MEYALDFDSKKNKTETSRVCSFLAISVWGNFNLFEDVFACVIRY